MSAPNKDRIVVEIMDAERGNIAVERIEPSGPFVIWFEMCVGQDPFWEEFKQCKTLTEAMKTIGDVLHDNAESGFYREGE